MKIRYLVSALAAAFVAGPVIGAQPGGAEYPNRPIRYVVGFAPGGGPDIVARAIAVKLSEAWGQQVVVDNRPGAGTIIGTDIVAKSPADGYTLLHASASFGINPSLQTKLPYDPKDLVAVMQTATQPYVFVVHPTVAVKNVKEFIALAKAKPNTLNFGSPGTGSGGHLAVELFKMVTATEMVHVPYRGGAPALTDLLGGQIQFMFPTILAVVQHMKGGRLRGIAMTSAKRSVALPDLPTVAESGVPGFEVSSWNGMMAPRGTPSAILAKINRDANKALNSPEVHEKLVADGAEPVGGPPEVFAGQISRDLAKWGKVIKAAGVRPD